MEAILARRRPLVPNPNGALEGWMDEDAAAAVGQLFGRGPAGLLVIDHRELLTSTARVVGAELGEIHFKVWMALITMHVAHDMPEDGRGASTVAEFAKLIWGPQGLGGSNTRRLLTALFELRDAKFTVPGYDLVNHRPSTGVSDTNLLINLHVDKTLLDTYRAQGSGGAIDRSAIGKAMGGQRGTIAYRLHPDYTLRLAANDLRRFDWTKAQQLRGAALALWMLFTSPRVPYRQMFATPGQEYFEIPLTIEHCQALGVHASADAARRRTLNEAGARVCEADQSFVAIEAHGGRGMSPFLRVIRHNDVAWPLDRPGQLVLETA